MITDSSRPRSRTFTWLLLFVVVVIGGLTYLPSLVLTVLRTLLT